MNIFNELKKYGADENIFAEAAKYPDFYLARVTAQYKGLYRVITEVGSCFAEISGKLRYEIRELVQYPAVGDFVMIDQKGDKEGNAMIYQVLPRKSLFVRASVEQQQQMQVIACNIDTVFICMSLNQNYNLNRLERYLSVAWCSGAIPVIVLTKTDLCIDVPKKIHEVSSVCPGVDILATTCTDTTSYQVLFSYLKPEKTVVFVGSSGVGKSTLLNQLVGKEVSFTNEIGRDDKGRHTTTHRELFLLSNGAIIIDTPGMRELGIESADFSQSFADITDLAVHCRFQNCTHTVEPGCAIQEAIASGILEERRLESYWKLKKELSYEGLSSRKREQEKLNRMFAEVGGMKKAKKFIQQNSKKR